MPAGLVAAWLLIYYIYIQFFNYSIYM
jgi:hypothetical protein